MGAWHEQIRKLTRVKEDLQRKERREHSEFSKRYRFGEVYGQAARVKLHKIEVTCPECGKKDHEYVRDNSIVHKTKLCHACFANMHIGDFAEGLTNESNT